MLLKKTKADRTSLDLTLLEFRNTPVAGLNVSPAQLMLNRCARTRLPISDKLLKPKLFPQVQQQLCKHQAQVKEGYDQSSKDLPELTAGQQVVVYNHHTKVWEKGVIEQKLPFRRLKCFAYSSTYST